MIYIRFKSVVTDYLIVGQGLAGSLLGYTLLKAGLKVHIADAMRLPSSSRVAAGIFNPVTGKNPVKTWQADLLFPFLHEFYPQMEADLGVRFFYPKRLYRPFLSIEEQNNGLALTASAKINGYLQEVSTIEEENALIRTSWGGLETKHSGYVDVDGLLTCFRNYLTERGALINRHFDYTELKVEPGAVEWGTVRARKVIFCEGAHAIHNPYFNWLPFRQVKGEILSLETDGNLPDCIIKQGVYLVPTEAGICRLGATYERNEINWETSPKAREELTANLDRWIRVPYRVVEQRAGVRPATPDRRPFIGLHPDWPSLGVFNGLGSKGVSLAPYYSHHFYEYLECGKELSREVNIDRYYSLISSKNL
jgi:glycine/D-amino acid oxidase-like deaminating enzyme